METDEIIFALIDVVEEFRTILRFPSSVHWRAKLVV